MFGYVLPALLVLLLSVRLHRLLTDTVEKVRQLELLESPNGGPLTGTSIPQFCTDVFDTDRELKRRNLRGRPSALLFVNDTVSLMLVWSCMEVIRLRMHRDSEVYVFYSSPHEGWRNLRASMGSLTLRCVWLRDSDGRAAEAFNVRRFPTTVGVDAKGYVDWVSIGEQQGAGQRSYRHPSPRFASPELED